MANRQKPQSPTPALSRGRLLIPILSVLVLAALAVGAWVFFSRFPRLEVSGFRISQEEYLRAMYQARNDVLSDHAAAGISLKDFHTETALGDPCRLTTERALEILSEYYAVSTLAVERGYLSDAGYEAMVRDMEEVNAKRQAALDSGAIVTGIPTFSLNDYLSYRASNLRLQFCNDDTNPEYPITDEALRERYEADRDNLYGQPDSLQLAFVEIEFGTEEQDAALNALHQSALSLGSLSAALEQYPELQEFYQEISVEPGNYGAYDRTVGDVLACAEELQSGEISRVFRQDGWLCLVECRQRTVHQYVPLEDVASIVAQSIRESRYDALIAERMESMEITGDPDRLYRFTAEYLP